MRLIIKSGIGLHFKSSVDFVINRSFLVCRDVRNFTLNGLGLYISQPPFFLRLNDANFPIFAYYKLLSKSSFFLQSIQIQV
ncbi:MAG: hypothetical protein EBS35_08035 [Bacteroidetes bacterium]|nr:hypothetical protein [Bacteroidota bacterium]